MCHFGWLPLRTVTGPVVMVIFLLMWLALSAAATLAFVFGANVGHRRGLEEARAQEAEPAGHRVAAAPGGPREVRLPEDIDSKR